MADYADDRYSHPLGERYASREMQAGGRYLAEHIPGARIIEVPGRDHFPWVGDTDAILDEVEQFVTGTLRGAESDRVLAPSRRTSKVLRC